MAVTRGGQGLAALVGDAVDHGSARQHRMASGASQPQQIYFLASTASRCAKNPNGPVRYRHVQQEFLHVPASLSVDGRRFSVTLWTAWSSLRIAATRASLSSFSRAMRPSQNGLSQALRWTTWHHASPCARSALLKFKCPSGTRAGSECEVRRGLGRAEVNRRAGNRGYNPRRRGNTRLLLRRPGQAGPHRGRRPLNSIRAPRRETGRLLGSPGARRLAALWCIRGGMASPDGGW